MNVTKVSKEFIRMKPRGNPNFMENPYFLENPFFCDAHLGYKWSPGAVSSSMRIIKDGALMIDRTLRVPIAFALDSLAGIKYSKKT